MGDHWTESTAPFSGSRVDPSVLDVLGLAHSEAAIRRADRVSTVFLGRIWLDDRKLVSGRGLHVDRSNGLQVLLPVSENSASTTTSVVSRRNGSVNFSPVFVSSSSLVNLCKDYTYQPTIIEEEFDVAVTDVNGLVLDTSPVSYLSDSHPESSLQFYHHIPAWVCGIGEKGRVLGMGGSQKSTRGKLLCEASAGVAGETERTKLTTNSPIEEEIEKYVCYTFATDTPDGWIEPDSNGLYSKEVLAYFSGGGDKRFDTSILMESRVAMESSSGVVGGLSKSFSMRNLGLEKHRLKSQQESMEREELADGEAGTDLLSRYGNWEQNGAAVHSESEGSYEAGSSPVFDESFYIGPTQLEAELQATSDAIEEMEGKVAIRLMVAEAVLRGIVRAVEVDASEAVEVSEAELLKVKQELQEKDSTVIELINTLKKKEEELVKLVDESRRKERRLVMEMLTERERILGKIKESEKYVAQKEKELLKMAEHMVELSLNLAAESKRVNVLEKQIKESKEAESRKGRELLAVMEKADQFRAEKESTLEMVRREARLKELRLTESLAEKEAVFSHQVEKIKTLETTEQQLREELDGRKQEELKLIEILAEKERILSKQLEVIRTLEADEQRLREEMDVRCRKDLELSESLSEKEKFVEELSLNERRLQDEVDSLNEKMLVYADSAERTQNELQEQTRKQEIETALVITILEDRLREELSLREKRSQDEIASLNEKMRVYKDAAQLAQEELQEQNWKHGTETALIMTTLEGRVMDLERGINLLGKESAETQADDRTFSSQGLQRRSLEISELRCAKLALEAKLSDAQAALKVLEETSKKQKEQLENKEILLQQADMRIAHLEQKLIKTENLFEDVQKEVDEMRFREEKLKQQQQVLECEVQDGRQNLDSAYLTEQELSQKVSQLRTLVEELEEKALRLEFEDMVISSYLENCSQAVRNLVAEVNKRSATSAKKVALLTLEVEAAGVELSKSKREVERLRLELCSCVDRMQDILTSSAKDLAEARTGLQAETANSDRLRAHLCDLQIQLAGLRKESKVQLSRKENEAMQLMVSLEESKWQSEVESFIVMGLAEGSIQELMGSLDEAREEVKTKNEDIAFLRCEVEELRQKLKAYAAENSDLKISLASKTQELCAFKTDFVLQNAMQRDALLQSQTQAKEGLKKIEELKRLKSILLERIQEEKQRWVHLEEAFAEQKWRYEFEMAIVSTIMSEAVIAGGSRTAEIDKEVARLPLEERRGEDTKKVDLSKDVTCRVDPKARIMKGKSGKADVEVTTSKGHLSRLDLLVRENSELRREKEQLLTQKTEEIYKLKREYYKELEKLKVERKKETGSDGSQKELPNSRATSKRRQQTVSGQEPKQNHGNAKLENVKADHERKLDEARTLWDAEKSTLLESISEKDDEIKELLTKLCSQGQAHKHIVSAKLEEVTAEYDRKVSDMRALWDAEKSASEERIKELIAELSQAVEKERVFLARQASLEEELAAVEKERCRLETLHEEEMVKSAAVHRNELDIKSRQLTEALKDAEEKSKRVGELNDEVREMKDEASVLRSEVSSVRKQMEIEFAREVESLVAMFHQLEWAVTQRSKHYDLRLQRAHSLLSHLAKQCRLLVSREADHMQNLQNLQKAEAEVDLLGDEVDALMDLLEKVYTVLSHYQPVIQLYPGLADLAKVVRNEVLRRLRDSDDVSL